MGVVGVGGCWCGPQKRKRKKGQGRRARSKGRGGVSSLSRSSDRSFLIASNSYEEPLRTLNRVLRW